ncbi:MAG TPA: L-seryl-tRNA(Sec) selenium transferase, partial [Anaerolineae bacterium]|nr:L-seryl-tRNA(Sec) selenium transferase [Anaerolineae bacterium]
LRKLPSIERVLQRAELQESITTQGRPLVIDSARQVIGEVRREIGSGEPCPALETLLDQILADLETRGQPTLARVINATGVIVHTNLGRAPLSEDARAAMDLVAQGYSNLEYDLSNGSRGSRYDHAEGLLKRLTGAGGGLLVNNNAGAILLTLTALGRGREAIISRGQLIEIGGGFRIPDVMQQSGVRLVEVGTTNRTHIGDYESAINEETALLLHVHYSNFRVLGFARQVALSELADVANQHGLLAIEDLGSGCLLDTTAFGLAHEPTVQEAIAQGADLVCFSGDKLLGGPQAGIVVGRADLIALLKMHPLARALRVDKTTIAGFQANLLHYLRQEATEKVPVWRMISLSVDKIQARADSWVERLRSWGVEAEVIPGLSTVGGGSLPGETLPTRLVALRVTSPDRFAQRLRIGKPPVVGRIEGGQFILDPRSVLPEEGQELLSAVEQALQS